MPLIEGVGDEVVEFFIGLIFVIIGIAAWWSTRIADRPLIRTVVVLERRTQSHTIHPNNQSTSSETRTDDQRDYVQDLNVNPPSEEVETDSGENKPPRPGCSVEPSRRGSGDASNSDDQAAIDEQNAIVESMDSDANVLRRRRLEFFQPSLAANVSIDELNTVNIDTFDGQDNDVEDVSRTDSTDTTETTLDEDDIRIKLKYINDDLKLVNGKLQEPLGDFKRRHFEMELASDKLVRLIFNGQVLQRDDLTLQGCGLFDNCVVHCLVHQKRPNSNDHNTSSSNMGTSGSSAQGSSSSIGDNSRSRLNGQQQQGREWDLGNLFFAIVSFMLGAAWYFRYEYAQLYTVTATVALVGLTGIFTVLLVGMYFPDPEPPVQTVRS